MKLAVFIATAMLAAGSLTAQELTASISGAVLDSSGAVIPDAAVAMLNAATRVLAWQGRTNGSGLYSAPALPVGRYDISVEAKGFKKSQISGIELRVDQRARWTSRCSPANWSKPSP